MTNFTASARNSGEKILLLRVMRQSPLPGEPIYPTVRETGGRSNHFSVALSNGDGKVLAQMNGAKDEGRLASLLASYGGRPTVPVAYDSEDRDIANVEFAVKCSSRAPDIVMVVMSRVRLCGRARSLRVLSC